MSRSCFFLFCFFVMFDEMRCLYISGITSYLQLGYMTVKFECNSNIYFKLNTIFCIPDGEAHAKAVLRFYFKKCTAKHFQNSKCLQNTGVF